MKELKRFKSVAAGVLAATILILGSSLTTSCSTDVETSEEQNPQEGTTFPVYVRATNGSQDQTRAVAARQGSAVWIAENGEEDINPEGWNDPLGESATTYSGKKKTQYSYNSNRNTLEVLWKAGDEIGIKALNSSDWTPLALTEGGGMKVASFEGLASSGSGLSPTGSQDIASVYPFRANGSYSLASQAGTIDGLGTHDIRVDTGTIVNGTVTDLYYTTRISVLRIATTFFDEGDATKTKGKTELTVTVEGAGIGNQLDYVCTTSEQATAGPISATVAVDPASGKPLSDVYIAFVPIDTDVALFTIDVQSGNDGNTYSRYTFYKSHFAIGKMYNLKHPGTDVSEECIKFKDSRVEAICLQNFDSDDNGCISYREARSVNYLGQAFSGSDIRWFPELKEFTGLTMIPANAFNNCISLEEIKFPASVTEIGTSAFMYCSKLPGDIALPWCTTIGNSAFYQCKALSSVDIPLCTTIGSSAFSSCTSLSSVDIPLCTTIGGSAFMNCDSLSTINFPKVTSIGESAFMNCDSLSSANFPECTTIGRSAFSDCTSLSSADFPLCTTIGSNAFRGCTSLPSADFPVCTTIGSNAFSSCTSLTSADFPVCTSIGESAFRSCTSLTSADFPLCTTIGGSAFSSCTSLTSADFPVCTTIGSSAFSYCSTLSSADFPVCTTIGLSAFSDCSTLSSANFPLCTTIDSYAFSSCTSLTSANFPLCTKIDSHAFYYCSTLSSADFPVCTTIGLSAFSSCISLTTINFPKVTSIGTDAFFRCPCGYPPLANP